MDVLHGAAVPARHGRLDQREPPRSIGSRDLDTHLPTRQLDEASLGAANQLSAPRSSHLAKLLERREATVPQSRPSCQVDMDCGSGHKLEVATLIRKRRGFPGLS